LNFFIANRPKSVYLSQNDRGARWPTTKPKLKKKNPIKIPKKKKKKPNTNTKMKKQL